MQDKKEDGQIEGHPTPHTSAIQSQMLCTTTDVIPGFFIKEIKGLVFSQTVRSRGALGRFMATIQGIIGGKTTSYISELEKAKKEALDEALKKTEALGCNALIGIDFDFSEVLEGYIMFSVNGTACIVRKKCSHTPEEVCENCKR